uniref:Uncharacterized protein n=1 Tax=Moniliophthora roreri TaxID=221103 RepID=A0A0W0FYG6_MONRR
MCAAEVAD